jgi:diphthamide biosynthesis enzyme Dph1/Dph2-like protein
MDIISYFDIESTVSCLIQNSFSKIALQFPDELLVHATEVSKELSIHCQKHK